MSSAEDIIIPEDRRLSAGAAEIKKTFNKEQKDKIRKVQAKSPADYANYMQNAKVPPLDDMLAEMIASVERSNAGEIAMTNFLENLLIRWPQLNKKWLKDLRKAVKSILGEGARVLARGNDLNVIDEDGFVDLVKYGLTELKEQNRSRPDLFRFGSEIAEIETVREMGLTTIRTLEFKTFKARLNEAALWRKSVGESSYKTASVPNDVAEQIYAHRDIPLPFLSGKITAPVFRPSGGLLFVPGYDEETGLYFVPPDSLAGLDVPQHVTEQDVSEAREKLVDLFCDFEMDGVSRADLEAAALRGEGETKYGEGEGESPVPPSFLAASGWLLEQPVRPLLGSEPLMPMLVSKTAPGAGGSLIAKVLQTVTEGRTSSRPLAKTEEEIRKATFTALQSSPMTLYFDNLPMGRTLESDVLATLFTEPYFTDRVLGRSAERSLPMRSSTIAVGNRPLLSDQLRRRFTLCELVPQHANPERRTGFKHPNLLRHVADNRVQYLRAVLVLVQNWIQRGKPAPVHAPVVGSYEAYSTIIPGILEAASPYWTTWGANLSKLDEIAADDEEEEVKGLLDFWAEEFGTGYKGRVDVAELLAAVERVELVLPVKKKRTAVSDFDYDSRSMTSYLKGFAGRVFELGDETNVKLVQSDKRGNAGYPWIMEAVQVRQPAQEAPKPVARRTRPENPPTAAPAKSDDTNVAKFPAGRRGRRRTGGKDAPSPYSKMFGGGSLN
jgi:hypothetical protein